MSKFLALALVLFSLSLEARPKRPNEVCCVRCTSDCEFRWDYPSECSSGNAKVYDMQVKKADIGSRLTSATAVINRLSEEISALEAGSTKSRDVAEEISNKSEELRQKRSQLVPIQEEMRKALAEESDLNKIVVDRTLWFTKNDAVCEHAFERVCCEIKELAFFLPRWQCRLRGAEKPFEYCKDRGIADTEGESSGGGASNQKGRH